MRHSKVEVAVAPGVIELREAPEWEQVDSALRQLGRADLKAGLEAADWIARGDACMVWERKGFPTRWGYYENVLGRQRRSIQRWVSVREGLARLKDQAGEDEAESARFNLLRLTTHKAGILAPLLGEQDWRGWVEQAEQMSEDALQEVVSLARGLPPKRDPEGREPDADFFARLVAVTPPDRREQVEGVFAGLKKVYDCTFLSVFLLLVDLGQVELASQGKWRHEP